MNSSQQAAKPLIHRAIVSLSQWINDSITQ
jgi:hypothetical protein